MCGARMRQSEALFMPLRPLLTEIFLGDGGSQIDVIDVGQSAEPGEDIGEFFLKIIAIIAMQGGGQFAHLFDEPEESARRAALAVGLLVAGGDVLLEGGES